MRVILLQNIKGVGQIGDIKNVSDGYGRNFLLPNSQAKLATPHALKEVDALKKKRELVLSQELAKIREISEKLQGASINLSGKANSSGKLFASIGAEDIANKIRESYGVVLDKDIVDLKEHQGHIKQIGEHVINLNLSEDLKVPLKITVEESKS